MTCADGRISSCVSRLALLAVIVLAIAPPGAAQEPVVWEFSRLDQIGGQPTTILGAPRLIDALGGQAVEFDGLDDAIILPVNPLTGLSQFTVEVIFRPAAGGPQAQRFVHFQEEDSENRLLFETRLTADNRWFLDTFLKTSGGNHTLFADKWLHGVDAWHHAAVVIDGRTMRHYVNGVEELSMPIQFQPLKAGPTSFGARLNRVSWFKGAIRQIRVTPRTLTPREFTQPDAL